MSVWEPLRASLVTCSYSGDFEVCTLLCESVDRFASDAIEHILYVPERDVPLFSRFATARRRIATQESLLPQWFWNVPLPSPRWRKLLRLPRRNVYLTPFSMPVRGWIAQQLMKLAATQRSDSEIVVHVDSDTTFLRGLGPERLIREGKVRLFRDPMPVEMETHRSWQVAAGRLLGLPPREFYGGEYIDQMVVWRKSVLLKLLARIAEIGRADWRVVLARTKNFAEYILYGVFADQCLGLEAAGLYADTESLTLSRWSGEFNSEQDEQAFLERLQPGHVTCLIQSTLSLNLEARRRLLERATQMAAAQDARLASRAAPV